MAKFIICGDIHYRLTNPRARLDDYPAAIIAKLREVMGLAKEHNAKAILIPGDIFDSASVSIPAVSSLAKIFASAPCPVLAIPGNHDSFGHNLDSILRTPYGLLKDLEFINCAHDVGWGFYDNIDGIVDGLITGHGFDTNTDRDLLQYGIDSVLAKEYSEMDAIPSSVEKTFSPFYIHMVHGMLLDKSPGFDMRHTLMSNLQELPEESQPHVLVCGHYHLGLPIQRIGKTLVINPGALCRLSAHAEELEREVRVALLTVNSVDDYSAELIPLKSAQPGYLVLSREHLANEVERVARLEKFLSLLASEGEAKFMEVREIVEDIALRESIPAEVRDEALRRIGAAREALGSSGAGVA